MKLLPPTLSPGQAWPGLWEEQGRPQHSHWEVGGREGPPPHGRHREGGGLHLLAFSPSALGSRASFLSERRGHALRSLSRQLLRGFIHVSVQLMLNRVWSHRDSEAPSLSTGLTAT